LSTFYRAVILSFWIRIIFSELESMNYLVYSFFFLMMIVAPEVRMFNTVFRTRQFFSLCRTTCFFGICWIILNKSTFHTLLFHFLLVLSCSLFYVFDSWFISSFWVFKKNVLMNWTLLPYVVPVPISRSIPSLYLVKNINYDAAVCTPFFVLFSFCRICQNYCPANFSFKLSVWIFSVVLESAIYSSRWSVTSDTGRLDMSTYLRQQSFNL
jgi:hypothetical protein